MPPCPGVWQYTGGWRIQIWTDFGYLGQYSAGCQCGGRKTHLKNEMLLNLHLQSIIQGSILFSGFTFSADIPPCAGMWQYGGGWRIQI